MLATGGRIVDLASRPALPARLPPPETLELPALAG